MKFHTLFSLSRFFFMFTLISDFLFSANYGDYVCQARNSLGSSVHTVSLVKKSKPDTPAHLHSLQAMSDSVKLGWREKFDGGIKNVTFKVQYRPQGSIN